jgi:predicted GNAT family N-acyltransferase
MSAYTVRIADWTREAAALRALREAVFVVEQRVPVELEWDGLDAGCEHALALDAGGSPIGTGRLLPDGHIGRMAVLRDWRGRGVGRALLALLVERARIRGDAEAVLNAQTSAIGFYEKQGFVACGPEFLEAGIAHREMRLALLPPPAQACSSVSPVTLPDAS